MTGVNDTHHDLPTYSCFSSRRSLVVGTWLLGMILLGAWLRCSQANEFLWLDELHTSWVVSAGLGSISERAAAGNQSPLYFVVVWLSVQVFGHSEWALRLPSLLAGIGLVGAIFWLVKRWSGSAASGLFAASLAAVDVDCIFFAQEARPYAMVQLSAVLCAYLFGQLIVQPTIVRRISFGVGAVWLYYLHYTSFLFLVAALVCFGALSIARRDSIVYAARQAFLDAALVGLLIAISSPHLWQIAGRRGNWARIIDAWPSPAIQSAATLFVAMPLAIFWAGWASGLRRSDFRFRSPHAIWAVCWVLVPAGLAWGTTVSGLAALWMMRYLVASLAGAIVFAGLCHATFANRGVRLLTGMGVFAALVWSGGMIHQWQHDGRWIGERNEPWPIAIEWLSRRWDLAPLPVFLCPGLLEDAALQDNPSPSLKEYCLFPLRGIYSFDPDHLEPLPTSTTLQLDALQQQRLRRHGGAWFLVRAYEPTANRIMQSLIDDLRSCGISARIGKNRSFRGLTVVQLQMQQPAAPQ